MVFLVISSLVPRGLSHSGFGDRLRRRMRWMLPVLALLTNTAHVSHAYTISGDIVCDNDVRVFTAAAEGPAMTVNVAGSQACWPNPQAVNFTFADRFVYLGCWSDDNIGQGLLHDLAVTAPTGSVQVMSGSPLWRVAPTGNDIDACGFPASSVVASIMASMIPTLTFVAPSVGCSNPPTGSDCYGIWGHVASIDLSARWSWFDSGLQSSVNTPFQPGFNHREFLIFRLDMLDVFPTATASRSWGTLKLIYR